MAYIYPLNNPGGVHLTTPNSSIKVISCLYSQFSNDYYQPSDICLIPSYNRGFPFVIEQSLDNFFFIRFCSYFKNAYLATLPSINSILGL